MYGASGQAPPICANAVLHVLPCTAVTLGSGPQSVTTNAGVNVRFTVSISTGSPAPAYQWRFNGTDVSGATGSAYTRSNVTTSDNGTISVVVSNGCSVLTPSATLTVVQPFTNWWVFNGNNLTLGWAPSIWFLQAATNVSPASGYHDVPGATSPFTTNVLARPQMFFRWRSQ